MNRALGWINLVGVLVLSGLCGAQWRNNRRLNHEVVALEKVRLAQKETLASQVRDLQGAQADLERFREQLTLSAKVAQEAREAAKTLESQVPRLTAERDRLQEAMTHWTAAVQLRDVRLSEADAQIHSLAKERNAVVERFNELAARHEKLVAELNAERARAAAPPPRS